MGQQQLLLVILVTIIVGIATVAAINIFGTSAQSANRDAVRQDVLVIAAASQGWYLKPKMMGGGGNSFAGMTFRDFNFSTDEVDGAGGNAKNMNGTYTISSAAGETGTVLSSFTVTAYPSSDEGYSDDLGSPAASAPLYATVCKNDIAWGTSSAPDDCSGS